MRRAVIAGLVGVALLAAVLGGLLVRRLAAREVRRFPSFAQPLAAADYAALGARPGWSTRELTVAPDVTLRGLVRAPRRPGAPTVLLFPGNSGQQLAEGQRFLEALGAGSDLGLAVFSYRGFDGSPGRFTQGALREDGVRVYAQLREETGAALHVVGFSLGTWVASAVAAAQPPASLTLLAPFTELAIVGDSPLARLSTGERYETAPQLAPLQGPVLVLHGAADESLPVQMGREVAAALGPRARYQELPGVGHLGLLGEPRALQAVRDFVSAQAAR